MVPRDKSNAVIAHPTFGVSGDGRPAIYHRLAKRSDQTSDGFGHEYSGTDLTDSYFDGPDEIWDDSDGSDTIPIDYEDDSDGDDRNLHSRLVPKGFGNGLNSRDTEQLVPDINDSDVETDEDEVDEI